MGRTWEGQQVQELRWLLGSGAQVAGPAHVDMAVQKQQCQVSSVYFHFHCSSNLPAACTCCNFTIFLPRSVGVLPSSISVLPISLSSYHFHHLLPLKECSRAVYPRSCLCTQTPSLSLQDADAVAAVTSQLAAFQTSMENDSATQRSRVADLVDSAGERGDSFVDATMQVVTLGR